jgi:predicted transport protein
MADLKLFRIAEGQAVQLAVGTAQIEKNLQILFEANLEILLGVRFLATEYSTGLLHGGRIDTLGLDEDGTPVIIEYKRSISENVINQGLFYLDWLMDHQKEFQWLVMSKLGKEAADAVDWSAPRLLCIANDFTRYDEHAVRQIARNIELLRYRQFDRDFLAIELLHAPSVSKRQTSPVASPTSDTSPRGQSDQYLSQRIDYRLENASPELRSVWDSVTTFLAALGDDVQVKELKFYVAFKKIKNFVCLELYPTAKTVVAYLKLDPDRVALEPGFTRDVRKIGHFGTGDLEVVMRTLEDAARAQNLLQRAYDEG